MSRKQTSSWESGKWPTCPNNIRHTLVPDPNGAWVCEECKAAHKPRSKTPFRFAFALDKMTSEGDTQ
jgi:ribosomal protein L37AE/L43A